MKNRVIKFVLLLFMVNVSYAQEWMTNLEIAQNLALVQNKMVLMVWEETTKFPYPVLVNDEKGRTIIVQDLFTDEYLSPLIWKHFVPVIVSELEYEDLFLKIKGKRKRGYIEMFNDDAIKIMDVNGNVINTSDRAEYVQNITRLIEKYALNTSVLAAELSSYKKEKDFYSAYFLASKYMDFSMYLEKRTRQEIIDLSSIYLNEATALIEIYPITERLGLTQRAQLLEIQQGLIEKRPKKVLRRLKRMDAENLEIKNQSFVAFLYYTTHRILKNENEANEWKSKISSVNLKKAQMLINLNS